MHLGPRWQVMELLGEAPPLWVLLQGFDLLMGELGRPAGANTSPVGYCMGDQSLLRWQATVDGYQIGTDYRHISINGAEPAWEVDMHFRLR